MKKYGNPASEGSGFSTQYLDASRSTSLQSTQSGVSDWKVPRAIYREAAQDHELESLFGLLRSMAEYLEGLRDDGTMDPGFTAGPRFEEGIPVHNFRRAMQHLGLVLTEPEVVDMFTSADETGLRDQLLQVDEFMEMTADAQRDIHDGDHARSPSMLWRLTYGRLRLVQDARLMRKKVIGLRSLFGLDREYGLADDGPEGLKVAAQLVFDVTTSRNIYHKLNEAGRTAYLRLHRFRHIFAVAVWMHLGAGWVEDNSHQEHEWFSELHVDGPLYWLMPALEVCLLTPIHLWHCYLRKESSVHWKGDKWLLGKLVCVFFVVCDATHEIVGGVNTAPVSRLARPYLLLDLYSTVRSLHQQCFAALASLKQLMCLALVFLFFFVLAGMMMYPSPSDDATVDRDGNVHGVRGTSQGTVVFTDTWTRLANLVYLTFGAVNYPDIMLPSYIEDGAPALFYFLPAIVVFLFLFLNIVLASVCKGYTEDRDDDMVKSTAKRCVALTLAFRGIATGTEIDQKTFNKFVEQYRLIEHNYENPFSLVKTYKVPGQEELEQLWTELRPQTRATETGEYAFIGPFEFLKLPALLSARRFREGPAWALQEANCELFGVDRRDVHILVKEPTDRGGLTVRAIEHVTEDLVGKKVVVDKVRACVGGEKILTQKLQKSRSIAQIHADTALATAAVTKTMSKNTSEARKTCRVRKIPKGTSDDVIKLKFQEYGQVVNIAMRAEDSEEAFVTFGRVQGAATAIDAAKHGGVALGGNTAAMLEVEPVVPEVLDDMTMTQAGDTVLVRNTWNQHAELKLDWSSGVPLVWRRRTDIHDDAELVTFAGIVTKVDQANESLNIRCIFEKQATSGKRSVWDRFLRGGLYPPLRKLFLRRDVNAVIIWVILSSLVLTFYQYEYRNQHTREEQEAWHAVDYCITFFFVCELIAKILAFGFIGYWQSTWHSVDLLITTATVISTFSLAWSPSRSNVPEHRYWMLFKLMRAFRVFRLLRLLSALESGTMDKYRLIFAVTTHAAGAMRDFFFYVIVVFYVYSIVGIGWFGGSNGITQAKSKACIDSGDMPNPVLEGTGFSGASYTSVGLCYDDSRKDNWGDTSQVVSSYYYGMNFDAMSDAFVTLLHMLIMNNWHVTHEACVAVFEDNARLCIEYGANTTLVYAVCENLHSRWVVSAYFFSFEFYVALVLVNILMSFFLDIYGFVWDKYTGHFQESTHRNAHRNILQMVDSLAAVARDAGIEIDGHEIHLAEEEYSYGPVPSCPAITMRCAQKGCCATRSQTCAGCLLAEPAVTDIRSTHVPLFVPSYGMFAKMAGFDAVNLCQACRRYWSAIEMLTVQHGTISGLDQSIAEAMSQGSIQEERLDMELKVRIMLKLKEEQGYSDALGLPIVPIRPGSESDQ